MSSPTVSVIVPSYNRELLLPRALDSVVNQTIDDWEIVLVDDGSTDGTADIAARYTQSLQDRFVYIRQQNRGCSHARNQGVDASHGCFVTFLDSDDEYRPTKLERQLALFDLRPELGFVYSDATVVDLDGLRHDSGFDFLYPMARKVQHEMVAPGMCVCIGDLFDFLIQEYFVWTGVGMVRREVLGPSIRFPEDVAFGEEWLFYLRVARACRSGFVDEPLSVYHYQPGSLSRTDKHRNALRYHGLLQTIHDTFRDMNCEQRRAVRHNLGRLGRQLGYNAYRTGRYSDALRHLAKSLRYEPAARTFYHTLQAALRWLVTGNTCLTQPRSGAQNLPGPVQ